MTSTPTRTTTPKPRSTPGVARWMYWRVISAPSSPGRVIFIEVEGGFMDLVVANRFLAGGIVAMLALAGHLHPALCQLAPGARGQAIGLPPASTITGTLHRAPDGSIVNEQPSVTSSPAAAPASPSVGAKKGVSKA